MSTITFEDYCEDFLDLATGLMSDQQLAEARIGYQALLARQTKPAPQHPDMKRQASELRARCERLTANQRYAVEKFQTAPGFDPAALNAARAAVAEGERILSAKRATKADFIAHAEQNSQASRLMNLATRSAA